VGCACESAINILGQGERRKTSISVGAIKERRGNHGLVEREGNHSVNQKGKVRSVEENFPPGRRGREA